MRTRVTIGMAIAVLGLSGVACATRQPSSIADRFVRHGTPAVDLGGHLSAADPPRLTDEARAAAALEGPRPKFDTPMVAERFDEALRQRLAALQATPSAAAHAAVAAEYRRLDILDMAFRHLSAAIALAPRDPALYDQRARLWRAWGIAAPGVRDARRAVRLAPRAATAWNTLGLLLEEDGHVRESADAYRRAVALDPNASYARSNLCRVAARGGAAADTRGSCRPVAPDDPSSPSRQAALTSPTTSRTPAARETGGPVDVSPLQQ